MLKENIEATLDRVEPDRADAGDTEVQQLVRECRDMGYTMLRIAEACETTQNTVYNWQNGLNPHKREFVLATLKRLVKNDGVAQNADDRQRLGKEISKALDAGWTQVEIAKQLGVSISTVSHWHVGRRTPRKPQKYLMMLNQLKRK